MSRGKIDDALVGNMKMKVFAHYTKERKTAVTLIIDTQFYTFSI